MKSNFETKIGKINLLNILGYGASLILNKFKHDMPIEFYRLNSSSNGIMVSPWDISDITYYAIMNSNEFNSKTITQSEYYHIINDYLGFDDDRTSIITEGNFTDSEKLLLILWGHSRKQFWYQEKFRIRDEFNRQVEMLEILADNGKFDLNYACKEETGFSMYEYRLLLYFLAALGLKNVDLTRISIPENYTNEFPFLNTENIIDIRNMLAASYNDIRVSSFNEESFYIYPIVQTIKNYYINVNQYFLFRKPVDGPLWAIRNYYKKKNSKEFLTFYGDLFEKYVSKLLNYYVPSDKFSRIQSSNNMKLADWFLETPCYRLIIEQKAFLPELALMGKFPDLKKLLRYLEKYKKGVIQLDNTEVKNPSTKITLKILLHYDLMNISNGIIKDHIMESLSNNLNSTSNIYFMDITSFERLLQIYKTNIELFELVLKEKKENSDGTAKTGFEYDQILDKHLSKDELNLFSKKDHWSTYFLRQSSTNNDKQA
jgi:hypothetical protein